MLPLFTSPPRTFADESYRELHLFDLAYNSYLSYRPEKAVKEFRRFLEEFPQSSAKDAALFWYAKALLRTKSVREAKETFQLIKEQFPDSPFVCHIPEELEMWGDGVEDHHSVKPGLDSHDRGKLEMAAGHVFPQVSTKTKQNEKLTSYALQVGSVKTLESAEVLRKSLQKKVARQRITICRQGEFFKVRINGFRDIGEVNSMLRAGIEGLVIRTNDKACGI